MIETTGNLWDFWEAGEWVGITTNGIVKSNGLAVMGRGIAKQAVDRVPEIQKQLAWKLNTSGNHVYAFLKHHMFSFPTKQDWRYPSNLELIGQSCRELRTFSAGRVYLPRPGCSNGGLHWSEVKPVLEKYLPEEWFVVVSLESTF